MEIEENSIRNKWKTLKSSNKCIIEEIFKMMPETIPKLKKVMTSQVENT